MNPAVPARLGRLLRDYERLTGDEGAALRARDFSTLAGLHHLKTALLAEIASEGETLKLDRRVLWLERWLVALTSLEQDNVGCAARLLGQLAAQRENLAAARQRVRSFGHTYGRFGAGSALLCALS